MRNVAWVGSGSIAAPYWIEKVAPAGVVVVDERAGSAKNNVEAEVDDGASDKSEDVDDELEDVDEFGE